MKHVRERGRKNPRLWQKERENERFTILSIFFSLHNAALNVPSYIVLQSYLYIIRTREILAQLLVLLNIFKKILHTYVHPMRLFCARDFRLDSRPCPFSRATRKVVSFPIFERTERIKKNDLREHILLVYFSLNALFFFSFGRFRFFCPFPAIYYTHCFVLYNVAL